MSEPAPDHKNASSWGESLRTLVIAFLVAITFRSCAYEPFHIPSGSMKDTLLVGDYLFVSKYAYGYSRYSFPFGLKLFEGRVLNANMPKRGDIAVFRYPSNPRIDFIKRIIGLPGDRVQVKEGVVYLNGEPLRRERIDDYADDQNKNYVKSIPRYRETLPDGQVITILKQYKIGAADNTPIFTVPPGHYFMMGDNRDNSRDSRFMDEVGYIPEQNLVGRAEIIFFSTDGTAKWLNPISWFPAMRLERFFQSIK